MALRRATLSSMGGWVLNRFMRLRPVRGLTINMWAVAGLAFMGARSTPMASFSNARARDSGLWASIAPVSSARYSREREMASWMSMAAMGAMMDMTVIPRRPG